MICLQLLLICCLFWSSVSTSENPSVVVTAFFPIKSNQKHTMAEYWRYIANFMTIRARVVLFCPPDIAPRLRQLRNSSLPMHVVTDFVSIWDIPAVHNWSSIYHNSAALLDPDRQLYVGELWAVYNAKLWMVEYAMELSIAQDATYFFWVDIGSQREPMHKSLWPSRKAVLSTLAGRQDRVIIGLIAYPHAKAFEFTIEDPPNFAVGHKDQVQGTFFAGTRQSIKWYASEYYALRERWAAKKIYVGMDQVLMKTLYFTFPARFIALPVFQGCGNPWFYFWHHFSISREVPMICRSKPVNEFVLGG
jgi:hypothetical protein